MVNPNQTLLEKVAQVLYEEPADNNQENVTSWVLLSAEGRKPWLDDADRVLSLLRSERIIIK